MLRAGVAFFKAPVGSAAGYVVGLLLASIPLVVPCAPALSDGGRGASRSGPRPTISDYLFQPWLPKAPPLPPPSGVVLTAHSVQELFDATQRVPPGGTILIAEGTYHLPRRLEIRTSGVTLRGQTGRRDRVVLDGAQHRLGELLAVTRCSDVTIADLTIQNVTWNGIKLDTDTGVHRVTIQNCVLHNIWQRAVKGVRVPREKLADYRPRDCKIQFCLF
ncbi:MAG: hypothetical protein ACUVRO_07590 [Armatimonadota bacterium]